MFKFQNELQNVLHGRVAGIVSEWRLHLCTSVPVPSASVQLIQGFDILPLDFVASHNQLNKTSTKRYSGEAFPAAIPFEHQLQRQLCTEADGKYLRELLKDTTICTATATVYCILL